MQKTFMMLKPDAFEKGIQDKVIQELEAHGLHVILKKELTVDMEVMKTLLDHYHQVIDRMGKEFDFAGKLFNSFYFDGPKKVMPMLVTYAGEEDIIEYSRRLVGKTDPSKADSDTIRGKYGADSYPQADAESRLVNNFIHASDAVENVERELKIWGKYLSLG